MNITNTRLAFLICAIAAFPLFSCWAADKVVDLLIVAGQSNAVGFDTRASELSAHPRDKEVMLWFRVGDPPADEFDSTSGQEWTTLKAQPKGSPKLPKNKQGNYGNFAHDEGGFGPEIGLARHLLEQQPDQALAIVKVAYSATGIGMWKPGNSMNAKRGANGYPALMQEIELAVKKAQAKGVTLRPRAFIWVQGESNIYSTSESYKAQLEELTEALRKDLNAPKLVALTGLNTAFGLKRKADGPTEGIKKVVAGMKELADESPFVTYVDDWGCKTANVAHFSSEGILEFGKRFAEALISTESELRQSEDK